MGFYDALQLDPAGLKKLIRQAETPGEKHKMMGAIVTRSILLVLFSVLVITPIKAIFGAENSPMAVALLCILLGIRFVDFGYRIEDSMVNLAIAFTLLLVAPVAASQVGPILAAVIHVSAFFAILFMTSEQPQMGNGGLYTFAYIYLSGNPVTGELFWKRAALTLLGYAVCGAILYTKHRTKNREEYFKTRITNFRLSGKLTQWQLRLALGVGILLALGSFFNLKRAMWAAFACGSILGCYGQNVKERFSQRIVGTLAGTAIFYLCYRIMPESLYPVFGLMGGICLGFCTDYRYKTASNALGALLVATSAYGLQQSVFLRIANNFAGVLFGCLFLLAFQKITEKHSTAPAEERT